MLRKVFVIFLLSCLILIARSAPVKKEEEEKSLADKGSSVQVKSTDDEEELHKLTNEVPKVTKQGVAVVKTLSSSEKVVNGQKESTTDEETKVLKPGTNKVLADVEVSSQGKQNGNEAPKVETEVDIPDQGIAQKFKGIDGDQVPARNPMAFTPRAVAEYLLVSGDLDGFFSALEELVTAKVMSVEDAKLYEMEVEREYQILLSELEEPEEVDYYNNLNFNRPDKREDIVEDDRDLFNIESMASRVNLQKALDKEAAYAELAQALVNDYIKENEREEEEAYDSVMDEMNDDDMNNVIGLLADSLVSDEMNRESQGGGMNQNEAESEEEELNEIAQSMGKEDEVPVQEEGTEAEMSQTTDKKSRTSGENKETDDKKAKKADEETVPAKKAE